MSRRYRISFFKKLANSTGHEVDACQGVVEVTARTKQKAIDEACRQFAGERHVNDWVLRADRITAKSIKELASGVSARR